MDSSRRPHRHHHGPNLAQYRYLKKKYGKNAREDVFWKTAGLIVLLVGSLVLILPSGTDPEPGASLQRRELRASAQQHEIDNACLDGVPDDCEKAKEEIRKENCELYGEGCDTK